MVAIYHTAYPRLKKDLSSHELGDVYTPTPEELRFAQRHSKRSTAAYLGLLVQLKLVQRLGRFVSIGEVPTVIIDHIRAHSGCRVSTHELRPYYSSGAEDRHIKLIRGYLNIRPYDSAKTGELVADWARSAARTKEALADIINDLGTPSERTI